MICTLHSKAIDGQNKKDSVIIFFSNFSDSLRGENKGAHRKQ